jgi:Rieske Fe-S protein
MDAKESRKRKKVAKEQGKKVAKEKGKKVTRPRRKRARVLQYPLGKRVATSGAQYLTYLYIPSLATPVCNFTDMPTKHTSDNDEPAQAKWRSLTRLGDYQEELVKWDYTIENKSLIDVDGTPQHLLCTPPAYRHFCRDHCRNTSS